MKSCLFRGVKFAKNADPDKYSYSENGIRLNSRLECSFTDGSFDKNVIIFGVDKSSSVHNIKIDVGILGRLPTQGLDDTLIRAEAEYSMNFSRSNSKFCLSLHYNESNSFLFVSATKIYQCKANISEIKIHPQPMT